MGTFNQRAALQKPNFAVFKGRGGSHIAMAIALATGGAMMLGAVAEPAYAQKKKKQKEVEQQYSEAFRTTYAPMSEMAKAQPADTAALKSMVPQLAAAVSTPDDMNAGGNLIYSIGRMTEDSAIQLRGLEMVIASGKLPADQLNKFNFQAGQLAYQMKDFPRSRNLVQAAIDAGYREYDPEIIVAESYFSENNNAAGVSYLAQAIRARIAAGQPVDEKWIRRGLSVAYTNKLSNEANEFSELFIEQYPSETSWGDAVAITLNSNSFDSPAVLDLLRLARRTDTLRSSNMYFEYVDAADPRRSPNEVIEVIDEGIASGKIDAGDAYATEARATAKRTVAADRADLPALERDARAGSAKLVTVMAAADAFLSYDEYGKAEEFYTKSLGMPGVNAAEVQTRLGIAQIEQGKFGAAQQTLAQVQGARQPIARLWNLYAKQKAKGGTISSAAPAMAVEPAI